MRICKQQILVYMAMNNFNMKHLAQKIDMQANNLSTILSRGTCRPETAARIAEGLGVTVMDIIKEG